MTTGLAIFAATYFLIAVQRLPFVHLNRPAASLLGAVAMVGFGVLPLPAAYAAIDFDVLVFLLGLMLIVGYLEVGRFFEWTAEWILQRALSPARLMLAVVVGGGLLSALFVNDTICLVVTPVLLAALGPLRVRPHPYLIGLAMGANVGSVLSITGNPQNMLVGIWSGASFGGFLAHMLPVGVGGLAITYGYLRWAYRADLREPFRERLEAVPVTLDRPLVLKALALFGVAVVAWLAGGSLPFVAITAGACMVAIAQRDPAYAIDRVEWSLLLFFASLFVVMRGFEQTGAVAWIRGGERRDGDPVQSDLERSRGAPVATYRPDRSQPGPRVAGARDELDVCREPAAHRLDGEPDRGGAGGDARRADRLRGVRESRRPRDGVDAGVGDGGARRVGLADCPTGDSRSAPWR
ncbi:MAG: hypothetical protein DMD34_12330 [Gemmatimonadetes bacterium]|nr:MAG: hypothetical protein DMD34_12330 [Gemmatimonadota bacterium]